MRTPLRTNHLPGLHRARYWECVEPTRSTRSLHMLEPGTQPAKLVTSTAREPKLLKLLDRVFAPLVIKSDRS